MRRLVERKVQNAAVAYIFDAESVERIVKAGVGNMVELELGGKACPELLGEPLKCTAYVKRIGDGKFVSKGPYNFGCSFDTKTTAVIDIDGVEVIVGTVRSVQPYDRQVFYSNGIDPTDKKIIVLKSAIHFRADFGPIAKKIIDVNAGGMCPQILEEKDFKRAKRPLYPFDKV